jgi:sec-independent protein translocase protein TatA
MIAALLPTLGPFEMIVLLVVILIFFGVGKLPEVGRALGQSLKSFKEAQRDESIDVTETAMELEEGGIATPASATVVEKETV